MIGITGGIGSGKSVVSRLLRLKGYPVYDCDLEAKRIMDESREVLTALNDRFGDEICPEDGPINRPALSHKVFNDPEHLKWLNSLVHRLVREDLKRWCKKHCEASDAPCFVESAIMASSGLAALCSEIWVVDAPEDIRLKRAIERDHSSAEKIRQRMETQRDEFSKIEKSGAWIRVIDNSGTTPLLPIISQFLSLI